MVKVSVVIPVYNVEKYLEKCILSIINQTLKDIEIVIVNDGSTDNSIEIINKFKNMDSRIKVINKENEGLLAARGTGINIVSGKYILNIDGDDWIEDDCCEKMYNYIEKYGADMVICDYYADYKNNYKIITGGNFNKIDDNLEYLRKYLTGDIKSYIWLKMVRAECFKNIDFSKRISLGEDCYLTLMLSKKVVKVIKIDKPLIHYVIRDNSLTKKYDESITHIWNIISVLKTDSFFKEKLKYLNEEYNFFVYNHVLLGRIIDKDSKNKIHKEMYIRYMNENLRIFNNIYFKRLTSSKEKLLTIIYHLNYFIANVFNSLIKKIINIKNRNINYS